MANTFRGKAQISGSKMVFDVMLYSIVESADLTQNWEEDWVKNDQGDKCAVKGHDEQWDGDLGMALIDQSSSSSLSNAEAGAVFLAPLSTINITQCQVGSWNGKFQLAPGSSLKLQNTSYGKGGVKLRRWADSSQNDLLNSIPS